MTNTEICLLYFAAQNSSEIATKRAGTIGSLTILAPVQVDYKTRRGVHLTALTAARSRCGCSCAQSTLKKDKLSVLQRQTQLYRLVTGDKVLSLQLR